MHVASEEIEHALDILLTAVRLSHHLKDESFEALMQNLMYLELDHQPTEGDHESSSWSAFGEKIEACLMNDAEFKQLLRSEDIEKMSKIAGVHYVDFSCFQEELKEHQLSATHYRILERADIQIKIFNQIDLIDIKMKEYLSYIAQKNNITVGGSEAVQEAQEDAYATLEAIRDRLAIKIQEGQRQPNVAGRMNALAFGLRAIKNYQEPKIQQLLDADNKFVAILKNSLAACEYFKSNHSGYMKLFKGNKEAEHRKMLFKMVDDLSDLVARKTLTKSEEQEQIPANIHFQK